LYVQYVCLSGIQHALLIYQIIAQEYLFKGSLHE
jgi:hypothetical protein